MFQFSLRFAFFINFSSFKPDTENNASYTVSLSKFARFYETQCSLLLCAVSARGRILE